MIVVARDISCKPCENHEILNGMTYYGVNSL